jgi:hypothetical protein
MQKEKKQPSVIANPDYSDSIGISKISGSRTYALKSFEIPEKIIQTSGFSSMNFLSVFDGYALESGCE